MLYVWCCFILLKIMFTGKTCWINEQKKTETLNNCLTIELKQWCNCLAIINYKPDLKQQGWTNTKDGPQGETSSNSQPCTTSGEYCGGRAGWSPVDIALLGKQNFLFFQVRLGRVVMLMEWCTSRHVISDGTVSRVDPTCEGVELSQSWNRIHQLIPPGIAETHPNLLSCRSFPRCNWVTHLLQLNKMKNVEKSKRTCLIILWRWLGITSSPNDFITSNLRSGPGLLGRKNWSEISTLPSWGAQAFVTAVNPIWLIWLLILNDIDMVFLRHVGTKWAIFAFVVICCDLQ